MTVLSFIFSVCILLLNDIAYKIFTCLSIYKVIPSSKSHRKRLNIIYIEFTQWNRYILRNNKSYYCKIEISKISLDLDVSLVLIINYKKPIIINRNDDYNNLLQQER